MNHKCEQAKDVEQLKKLILGNGQPGILQTVVSIETTMKAMGETMEVTNVVQRGLLKFMNEEKAKEDTEASIKKRIKWLVALNISTGLSLLGIVVTLIIFIAK